MAPIRRYLRITKYSVLEVRIYLDNPSLIHSWLLNARDPILPKVMESVRPLVLPKLREERERERIKKKNKKKAIKDTVTEDEFEVSIFLTETETRHSLLHKQKHLRSRLQTKLRSNSSKLTGYSAEAPIDLEGLNDGDASGDYDGDDLGVPILREEDEEGGDDDLHLADIPAINETATHSTTRGAKRRRQGVEGEDVMEIEDSDRSDDGQDDDGLFVNSGSEDGNDAPPPSKRLKEHGDGPDAAAAAQDDKKKMAMDISYEGFSIYGRVLCLVVKRRDGNTKPGGRSIPPGGVGSGGGAGGAGRPSGQAMMENWISSTQIPITEQDGEDAGDE